MLFTTFAVSLLASVTSALRSSGNGVLAEPDTTSKKVAIIGAGAAGSSAAYHLTQFARDAAINASITVFERNAYIGGRTTTVNAWDDASNPIELGGSIFVSVNHILVNASDAFNLSAADAAFSDDPSRQALTAGTPELGLWNGREFVVITNSEDGWWEKAKLLWRYGLAPIRTNRLMKSTVAKFLKMYEEPVFPWRSLSEVVAEMGLVEATGVTGEQYLKENGIGELFGREVIQASTRVNYASNLGLIHGLETMVCMATNGAMAVEGGNWQIFSHMLASSPKTISTHLSTAVSKISKQPDGTYNLTTPDGTSNFDTIILAAPYQFSNLEFEPELKHVPDEIPYVQLHVTLFASPHPLDPAAFNLQPGEKVPQYVLTTLPEGEDHGSSPKGQGSPGFFSISIVSTGANPDSDPPNRPEYIYKIFSAEEVDAAFLSRILGVGVPKDMQESEESIGVSPENGPVTWMYKKLWHSYPYEYPRLTFEELRLDEGVWYTAGIESFISTMETSALMGRNVARLVVHKWVEDEEGKIKDSAREGWEFEGLRGEEQQKVVGGGV